MLFMNRMALLGIMAGAEGSSKSSRGWLMTAVSPWGENAEDAFDQGLVELGLGDARLIQVQGAMLPLGFNIVPPEPPSKPNSTPGAIQQNHAYHQESMDKDDLPDITQSEYDIPIL